MTKFGGVQTDHDGNGAPTLYRSIVVIIFHHRESSQSYATITMEEALKITMQRQTNNEDK
eukprot:5441517-Pyramimonas_sp.AAC.1